MTLVLKFSLLFSGKVLLVIVVFACGTAAAIPRSNGRPGCKTHLEVRFKYFQYENDPLMYWECKELNVDADCVLCPRGHLFSMFMRRCVPTEQYDWHPFVHPPSSSGNDTFECIRRDI